MQKITFGECNYLLSYILVYDSWSGKALVAGTVDSLRNHNLVSSVSSKYSVDIVVFCNLIFAVFKSP